MMKLLVLFCSMAAVSLASPIWHPHSPTFPRPTPTFPRPPRPFHFKRSEAHLEGDNDDHFDHDPSGRWKVGGYVKTDKHGTHWGRHISHTFHNGLSVKSTVDHSPHHGTCFGLGFEHKYRRRLVKEATVVGDVQDRDLIKRAVYAQPHGRLIYNPVDLHTFGRRQEGEEEAEHEIEKRDPFKRWTVEGGVSHNPQTGTSYSLGVSHTFGRRLAEVEEALQEIQKRDLAKRWKVHGTLSHNRHTGTAVSVGVSHTFGRRLAEVEEALQEIQKRQWTVGGHVNRNQHGTSYGGYVSKTTRNGYNFKGSFDKNPGGKSFGISAGKTWNHRNGSKTSLGAHYNHNSRSGHSGGVTLKHEFGRHRRADEDFEHDRA